MCFLPLSLHVFMIAFTLKVTANERIVSAQDGTQNGVLRIIIMMSET